ncbi:DUF4233 domain-containing protein [Arsenicicoccus piscis]|uniref:DUF4233 domain-containing protein n=1 Tax=Arsenicicoccus piscis TaxID=673954 RepID=UPI001F4D25DA|nr:DUF4233 domain-containing protein [Arsenicicoccus piscis]MCH8627293.1 DUF4233 domain-containing protein [Arsenicicoccus piscis]
MTPGLLVYGVPRRLTRIMLAAVVGSESIIILFAATLARGIAAAEGHQMAMTWLWLGIALAVLALVAAGTLRRPWGVTLGWVVQLLGLTYALVVPMMLGVVIIFGSLWLTAMFQGRRIDDLAERGDRRTEPPAPR